MIKTSLWYVIVVTSMPNNVHMKKARSRKPEFYILDILPEFYILEVLEKMFWQLKKSYGRRHPSGRLPIYKIHALYRHLKYCM